MARITDQDIPGALVALFGQHASKGKASQGASGTNRARKRLKKRPYKPKPNAYHLALWALSIYIASNYVRDNPTATRDAIARDCWRLAKRGQFPAKYWDTPTHITTTYHTTTPTSIERTTIRPYSYRDTNNRPTIPTYPAAVAGVAPARYNGATIAQLFTDTAVTYRRDTYSIPATLPNDPALRIVTLTTGTTTAATSTRGARPLLALVMHTQMGEATAAPITATPSPMGKGREIYPRYKRPKDTAPYYNAAVNFNITRLHNPTKADPPPARHDAITIDTAPAPAMGYRYNNNTTIATSIALSANPVIYTPRGPAPDLPFLWGNDASPYLLSPYTGKKIPFDFDGLTFDVQAPGDLRLSYIDGYSYSITNYHGDDIGTLQGWLPTDANHTIPRRAPWGFWNIRMTSNPPYSWAWFCRYDRQGALIEMLNADGPPYDSYFSGWEPQRVTTAYGNHQSAVPNQIFDFVAPLAFWTIPAIMGTGRSICSVDAMWTILPSGDVHRTDYPTTRNEAGGWQAQLTSTYIGNAGYYPDKIFPTRTGFLTYSAAQGIRHVQPDATYTQLAGTTELTPIGNFSFGYNFD